jgi:hypothetical protein
MKWNKFFTIAPIVGLASLLLYSMAATPGHGYISVPAAAFRPESHTYQYEIVSGWVRNSDGDSDYYDAPLELPHGATLTKLTFFWEDGSSTDDGYCQLWRIVFSGGRGLGLASVNTNGDAGVADSSEVTITMLATVDNSQYGYGLTVYLPDSSVEAFGAIVEYTYPVSLPLIVRNFQLR